MDPDPKITAAICGPPKRRSLRFIKGVLYLLNLNRRSKKTSKSLHVEVVASSELLNKVFGTMRPLHVAHNCSILPSNTSSASFPSPLSLEGNKFEDTESPSPGVLSLKSNSSYSSFVTVSEMGNATEYGSLNNLLEPENLIQECRDDDDHEIVDDVGDEMIDVKAEQFIARFYEQIRIQSWNNQHMQDKLFL